MLAAAPKGAPWLLLLPLAGLMSGVDAKRTIVSTSLNTCMDNSGIAAALFNVTFSPDDHMLSMHILGDSTISGNVTAEAQLTAYGFTVMKTSLDPCTTKGLMGLCPATEAPIDITFQEPLDASVVSNVPNIAYTIPDLDGKGRLIIKDDDGKQIACVEAPLGNGYTVHQNAVGWVTAVITGLGLIASAVTSGLGNSNTAAHLAANVLTLFGYFQAQAMIGMIAVELPPLVAAWTQNYDWALGIINIDFMQSIFTWYIRSTGGKPATLLQEVSRVSVQIAKRSTDYVVQPYMMTRAANYGFGEILDTRSYAALSPRSSPLARRDDAVASSSVKHVTVSGIERMAFKAEIEATNFFMTGLAFLVAFWCLVAILVSVFKGICELGVKQGWIKSTDFVEFRNGWKVVFKGIMYRVVLIGFPQMAVLCLWEFTHHDSGGTVVLAVFFLFSMMGILGWGCFRVLSIAKRSVALEKGPAYSLYADPSALNRWGFLYVQYRSSAYYYVIPLLVYTFVKAAFIGFGQHSGNMQSVVLMVIELFYLITVSCLRPFLDKRTNSVNIAIAAVNFINALFVFIFSGITKAPAMVAGVLGVVFFILNVIFAFVLLVLVLIAIGYALFSKNPEVRYTTIETNHGNPQASVHSVRDIDGNDHEVVDGSSMFSDNRLSRQQSRNQVGMLPVPVTSRGPSPSRTRSVSPVSPIGPSRRGSMNSGHSGHSEISASRNAKQWHVGAGYDR